MQERQSPDAAALRARFAADLAAGKTVALSAEEMADPHVRRHLPELLEALERERGDGPAPTEQVPGYTMLAEIGHGGMSTVWLARQDSLRRHVALKIAPKWAAGDPNRQRRLLQEAHAMARVDHPNIVAIHDIVEVGDTIAIAMDWVDGRTLQQLVRGLPKQHGKDDLRTIRGTLGTSDKVPPFESTAVRYFVRVVRDVALAVQAVHEARLLHLDIKPSNILIRSDGTPLLADFGVVREIDLQATHTKTFVGTPVYAAPEQLHRADSLFGPHTDVYSLGITLYEAVAREQPLQSLALTEILHDVTGGRIPSLANKAPVPVDLVNIVHKAIAPEPHLRYATAAELAEDLTAFLENRPVRARPLARLQRLQRWARNEPWKAALAGTLALVLPILLGLGTYLWVQMPALVEAARLDRLAKANQLKQVAYQAYMGGRGSDGYATRKLLEAIEVDPSASSLACLLSMMHEEADPEIEAMLQRHAAVVAGSRGLQMFAAKARVRRFAFTPEEIDALRTSKDPTDRYVLALDRLFVAEDARFEEAYDEAYDCLVQGIMLTDSDPLLHGLAAWAARRGTRERAYEAEATTIRQRWPDDPVTQTWLPLATEPFQKKDDPKPTALGDELVARFPGHPAGHEILAGRLVRGATPDYDGAIAIVERANAAGVVSEHLTVLRLVATALRDGKAAAEVALEQIPDYAMTFSRRLNLVRLVDPARAAKLCDDTMRLHPRPHALTAILANAARGNDADLLERSWQVWRQSFPDRRRNHDSRIRFVYRPNAPSEAKLASLLAVAELAAEMTLPRANLGSHGVIFLTALTTARNWTHVLRTAERVIEHGPPTSSALAHSYAGMAASRLGQRTKAAVHLGAATVTRANSNWYANAMLEKAWLQVDPDGLADARNPGLAKNALAEFEDLTANTNNGVSRGPWYWLVRAETEFANGEKNEAITSARKGLSMGHLDGHAPEDTHDRLGAALDRYLK
ncbi:MAG: serine/threonine protein kinase [Planctomycetes bacterium]|nr:serine/threonine protein kinase [Planctomycetota bacterium]